MRITRRRRYAGQARTMLAAATASLIVIATPVAAKPLPLDQIDFGPEPGWAAFRAMGEAAVKERLVDPDSARFKWPWGYHKGGWKEIFSPWVYGYYTCGEVNSRNRMGGFAGAKTFVVVINHDRVLYVGFGGDNRGSLLDDNCKLAIDKGYFAPAPADGEPAGASISDATSSTTGMTAYGLDISVEPDGARISGLTGEAARAGLARAMVVTSFNGISLKGLSASVIRQIIGAADGVATVIVLDGKLPINIARSAPTGSSATGGK